MLTEIEIGTGKEGVDIPLKMAIGGRRASAQVCGVACGNERAVEFSETPVTGTDQDKTLCGNDGCIRQQPSLCL